MPSSAMNEAARRASAAAPLRTVAQHRAAACAAAAVQTAGDGVVVTREADGSRYRVAPATACGDGVLLYLHSGGFTAGSPELGLQFAGTLARSGGLEVLLPRYRLAPEHPYPAALDDAVAAYCALVEEQPSRPVAVGGASAGGGLALSLLLAARQGSLPLPAAAVLVSPWLDLRLDSASMTAVPHDDPLNTREYLSILATNYRGVVGADDPLVSPVLADLSGLPPIHVEVGSTELLLDDSLALVTAASRKHVPVSLAVVPEALHSFPHSAPHTPEAAAATSRIALHLRTWLDDA